MAKKSAILGDEQKDLESIAPTELAEDSVEESTSSEVEVAKEVKAPVFLTDAQKQAEIERIGYEAVKNSPLAPTMVPLDPGEKPGAVQPVSINGYAVTIKKGVMVMVPQPIADAIAEKFHVEATAGEAMRVDRNEKTEDALM